MLRIDIFNDAAAKPIIFNQLHQTCNQPTTRSQMGH